ncbi:MAG: protein arginine kinase [Planctomycetes bacterium]|nr:protein arginine kinase [Planctomycetota bacterium]
MELSAFESPAGEWLKGEGPESDIVVSSRIRLARNLAGHHFLSRASTEELQDIESSVGTYLREDDGRFAGLYFRMSELSEIDRYVLVERHLISREHSVPEPGRAMAATGDESLGVMINEEDHLRIQSLRSGLQLREAWQAIDDFDTGLSEKFGYAFSPRWGYLTACPTNVGTGMRVSVMLHLPALVMTQEIEKLFRAISKINLAVRGLYGEGTQAYGDLYQVSNHVSLGRTEEKIIDALEGVVTGVIAYEHKARQRILSTHRLETEDRLWRAFGMLKSSRVLSSEEMMHLLSAVRLGTCMNILPAIDTRTLNEIFLLTQPAHLQKVVDRALSPEARDVERAVFIREKLAAFS